jgi:hypothetical protein
VGLAVADAAAIANDAADCYAEQKSKGNISLEQRLLQDLGIHGDDASELLLDLSSQFGVDLTALNFEKHFRPEPNLFSVLRLPSVKRREHAEKTPVSIRDLIVAANTGKWPL